jgi:hypothetical protein
MLSNGAHQQVVAPDPKTHPAGGVVGDAAVATTTQPQSAQNGGQAVTKPVNRAATTPAQGGTNLFTPATPNITRSTPVTTGSTGATAPATTGATTTTPTTNANPPTSTAPTAPTTTTPPSSGSSSGGGGLLGTVTGTLTGTLNSVTQPVFSWFGG